MAKRIAVCAALSPVLARPLYESPLPFAPLVLAPVPPGFEPLPPGLEPLPSGFEPLPPDPSLFPEPPFQRPASVTSARVSSKSPGPAEKDMPRALGARRSHATSAGRAETLATVGKSAMDAMLNRRKDRREMPLTVGLSVAFFMARSVPPSLVFSSYITLSIYTNNTQNIARCPNNRFGHIGASWHTVFGQPDGGS